MESGEKERGQSPASLNHPRLGGLSVLLMAVSEVEATVRGGQRAPTTSALIQWVSNYGPQLSSIKIAQELVRDDKFLGSTPDLLNQKLGCTPGSLGDSDANSSLRTIYLTRPDPASLWPVSCCPWPSR